MSVALCTDEEQAAKEANARADKWKQSALEAHNRGIEARRWAAWWKQAAEENRFYGNQSARDCRYLYDRVCVARRWSAWWKQAVKAGLPQPGTVLPDPWDDV